MKSIMKVYIVILTGKNARILGTYADEKEAIKQAQIYSIAYAEWCNVIEQEVLK